MKAKQFEELVLQSLEHEIGGVDVYAVALKCAIRSDLSKEWKKYHAETKKHVEVLTRLCKELRIDAKKETPGRLVVRHNGEALVAAMKMALKQGDRASAQLVACECVVLAETKDHQNWELLGQCALYAEDPKTRAALESAYREIEAQEDEHLYHSKGWCRELWIESLGLAAVLPPPEETREVKTAIGAAKAEGAAMLARQRHQLREGRV